MSGRDYIVRFYDSDNSDDFTIMEEVVRCKYCKYADEIGYYCSHIAKTLIDEYGMLFEEKVEPNSFCWRGERKDK